MTGRRESLLLGVAVGMLGVLALIVIPGSDPWSGPVLLTLSRTHGVHLADLGVVALGLALLGSVMAQRLPASRTAGRTA
jgi:hypothetical protein